MAIFCVYRDWIQEYVTWYDAVVGLNGEFVHIVQLGANHLRGAQLLWVGMRKRHHRTNGTADCNG